MQEIVSSCAKMNEQLSKKESRKSPSIIVIQPQKKFEHSSTNKNIEGVHIHDNDSRKNIGLQSDIYNQEVVQ